MGADAEPIEPIADRRDVVTACLADLATAADLTRVDEAGKWSVRKMLRRLVWHERIHAKSAARILAAYDAPGRPPGGR